MTYAYDRTAASDSYRAQMPYQEALSNLRSNFLYDAGNVLASYANTLHGRLRDGLSGEWQCGTPKPSAFGWEVLVYAKNEMRRAEIPEGIDTVLVIRAAFEGNLDVELIMGHRDVVARRNFPESASASNIGMFCGEAWEKLFTGSVDYGR